MKRVLKCVQVFYCDQVLKRVQEYNVSKSSKLGLFPFPKFMSCTKGLQLQYLTVNQAYLLFVDISAMSLLSTIILFLCCSLIEQKFIRTNPSKVTFYSPLDILYLNSELVSSCRTKNAYVMFKPPSITNSWKFYSIEHEDLRNCYLYHFCWSDEWHTYKAVQTSYCEPNLKSSKM